jgi:hypothetical protein
MALAAGRYLSSSARSTDSRFLLALVPLNMKPEFMKEIK